MTREMPDWFEPALRDAWAEDRRARLVALPSVKFVCGRDWFYPRTWAIGFMWGKNLDAIEGEIVYRHELIFAVDFRLWLRRR